MGGETIYLNLSDPNFTASIPTSPLLSMGRHSIVISVNSSPPVMGAVYTYGIFVINILEIVIPIIMITALTLSLKFGIITLPSREETSISGLQYSVSPPMQIVVRPSAEVRALRKEIMKSVLRSKIGIKGVRDIVDALASVIYVIGNRTGIRLKSTDTLREYLRAVQGKLSNEEFAIFAELVRIGEYALYSPPHIPSDEDVRRAWELARRFTQ